MAFPSDDSLWATLEAADEVGVKLEMVGGVPIWEAMPGPRHQRVVKRIDASITSQSSKDSKCECVSYMDVIIRFTDGSYKRPDISVFCREPDEEEGAVSLMPEAVIEVVSRGYEAKDYEFGLPFYQKMGIRDVIIFDPSRSHVLHARLEGSKEFTSPTTIRLECGCLVTV